MTVRLIIAVALILITEGYSQSTPDLTQEEALALLVNRVAPRYPPLARQARIQGDVVLRFTIGEDGIPTNIRVFSGHPMLSPSAVEAVKQWRFRPHEIDEKPVEAETEVIIKFKLGPTEQERADTRQNDWVAAYEQRSGEKVYRSTDTVAPPGLIDAANAITPSSRRNDDWPSSVEVWCIVDATGTIAEAQVVSTDPAVQSAAMRAVRRWKFKPARDRGLPVAYLYTGRVYFSGK